MENEQNEVMPLTDTQKSIVEILEKYLEMAKHGDLLNLYIVSDHVDDCFHCKIVLSGDVYSLGGYILASVHKILVDQITPDKIENDDDD